MHIIETRAYQKAFVQYLRRGIPIDVSFKAMAETHPTTHYVWRTSGDNKVRPSHAANDGKIFAWNDPPETGHPGADYNCRCTAEPYVGSTSPKLLQNIRNILLDYLAEKDSWKNFEMSLYFLLGNGEGVTLEAIGHAEAIQHYYAQHYLPRFHQQIRQRAAQAPAGRFGDDFDATYNFREVFYSYRTARVKGRFIGEVTQHPDGTRIVSGKMSFLFYDQFKDPLSLAQLATNVRNVIPFAKPIREEDLWEWFRNAADLWQKPYSITGEWGMDYQEIIP